MARTTTKNSSTKTAEFVLSPGIQFGSFQLRFYSLFFAAALICGYFISRTRAVKERLDLKVFEEVVFYTVVFGFLSARVYYVLTYWYLFNSDYVEIIKVWHGGISVYGGLIGAGVALFWLTKKNRLNFWQYADIFVFGLPLAQAIGRIGNYFNHEAFGMPTNLPWKMFVPAQFRPVGYSQYQYFHPTFAYELLWNLLVFALLFLFSKHAPKRGVVFGVYLAAYSLGRFFIEAIRLDSAYFFGFKTDQIIAALLSLAALAIIRIRYAS